MLDRTQAPKFHLPEDFTLSDPVKWLTPSGVPVFYFRTPLLEAVKIEIVSKGARKHLPLSKNLVPSFTLQLLTEGTHSQTENQLSEFFDFYASEVQPSSGFSREGISLLTTKKHLTTVLPVFLSLLTEANFPEEKLKKKKSLRKLGLKLEREKTSSRASQLFRMALFGPNHPYGLEINEAHIDEVSRQDLLDYRDQILWNEAEIFISGDFSLSELNELNGRLEQVPYVRFVEPAWTEEIQQRFALSEERPQAFQTSIRIGAWSIPKNHPDYFPLSVFNTVLGGYFGSRLIKNIREDKGHTYGISSSLGEIDDFPYWSIAADVQKQFKKEVLEEIRKEIHLLSSQLIAPDELELVRNYLIGQMVGRFSTSFDWVDRYKSVHFSGLDFSFYRKKMEFLRSFDAEEILEKGSKYFTEAPVIEITVG
ncbi:M16 family metallopeptidase [Algoriphagus confluentis]|uniref:Pitrilysin family protein n=1 Tax=Algoriphagus confluentis TaxID=1697556 RepID=A0ABQ6PS13_9BACT|nr:pitrilysin family protein [Algoriphagus confluentis]